MIDNCMYPIITEETEKSLRFTLKEHGSEDFPFLVSYERLGNYVSGSFFTHWHPEIEITLATEGQMLYKVNREVLLFKKGEVLVSNTNVLHSGTMDGEPIDEFKGQMFVKDEDICK